VAKPEVFLKMNPEVFLAVCAVSSTVVAIVIRHQIFHCVVAVALLLVNVQYVHFAHGGALRRALTTLPSVGDAASSYRAGVVALSDILREQHIFFYASAVSFCLLVLFPAKPKRK
jgi:hypothetical protein